MIGKFKACPYCGALPDKSKAVNIAGYFGFRCGTIAAVNRDLEPSYLSIGRDCNERGRFAALLRETMTKDQGA